MNYKVNVTNKTGQASDFTIFQVSEQGMFRIFSLAWLCRSIAPQTVASFEWENNYSFVCGQPGDLRPGTRFNMLSNAPANPDHNNSARLENRGGRPNFDTQGQGIPGNLQIITAADIQYGQLAIGIGMAGNAVSVTSAGPNLNYIFNPKMDYFIAAGRFTQGQVLDVNPMPHKFKLNFNGSSSLNVTLNANNTWS